MNNLVVCNGEIYGFRKLKEEASNIDPANEAEREAFIKELEQLYREGKLNPEEYRIIEELLLKKG